MSGFLLDTNVPSELVRPQPEPKVKTWVAAQDLDTLFISCVSFGELRKGIVLRSPGNRREELEAWIETDLSGGAFWRVSDNLRGGLSMYPMARSRPPRWSMA
jgi:predicted nucleic acid-binding protein